MCPKAKVFSFFILLFFADVIKDMEALKSGEDGVCVAKLSVPKTRTKLISRRCGKKRCITKKTETYSVQEEHSVCCRGWEYDVHSDSCLPICSTGCDGGKCVAPDVCQCEPPSTLDPDQRNSCIRPSCDPPCVNAECGLNNTCQCHPKFTAYNITHCFNCEPGYTADEALNCIPICEGQCVNGNCTDPNKCTCLDGYSANATDSFTCEAICDNCENSMCVAPNKCVCLEGFTSYNDTVCVPKCVSCDGECVGPNVCRCRVGYENVDGTCKPICDMPCLNGFCSAPNVCSCHEGHVKNGSDPTVCFKSCEQPVKVVERIKGVPKVIPLKSRCPKDMRDCSKKEKTELRRFNPKAQRCCVKKVIEYETRPTCCVGWEFVKEEDLCRPKCRLGCQNGRCVAPNVCECDLPLILQNNNKCVQPVCDPKCINSQCVNNDTCECNSGLDKVNSTHCAIPCGPGYEHDPATLECVPQCDSPCLNGTCTAPNTCTCIDGYKPKGDNYTCIPHCTPECKNADCIFPDTCNCWNFYNEVNNSYCSPICNDCINGDCVAPFTCECREGYSKKDEICTPDCDEPCGNGICAEPNICKCNIGYNKDPKNNFNCLPICEPNCFNASCVSPNTCSCHIGFEEAGNNWTCKPKCDICMNGECVAPEDCRCNYGYSMKYTRKCTPDCSKPCLHGECAEPDKCACDKGYKLASGNDLLCMPICERNCVNSSCVAPNKCACFDEYEKTEDSFICKPSCKSCNHGDCVSPNNCVCHEGFKKIADECSPVCSDPCVNGFCSSPDICSCKAGYMKNSTKSSQCFKPCKGLCDYGECTLDGECLCNSGYHLNNDTCIPYPPVECSSCESNCTVGLPCQCTDGRPCIFRMGIEAGVASPTGLAGLELTWMLGAAILLLLVTLVMVVIYRIWRKRKEYGAKNVEQCNTYGSVVYTVPDTLLQRKISNDYDNDDNDNDCDDAVDACDELEKETGERLLKTERVVTDDNALV